MNSVPDPSQWDFQASESGYTIKKVREDRLYSWMKLVIEMLSERFGTRLTTESPTNSAIR